MKKTIKAVIACGLTLSLAFSTLSPMHSVQAQEQEPIYTVSAINLKDIVKHWAESIIKKALDRGIIKGYPDGSFRPDSNVTRAEFATFLSRAFDGEEHVKHSFVDVSNTYWATDAINEGLALGFIDPNDYANKKFEPEKKMTRAEIAKWLVNGLITKQPEYKTIASELGNSNLTLLPTTEFLKGGIAKKDIPYVGIAMGTGLMVGDQNSAFKPSGNTTRAEVSTVIMRFLDVMKKKPDSFSDLNELVEVAKTGTNINSITSYRVSSEYPKEFINIRGVPVPYKNGIGTGAIERIIFLDTRNPSNIKSVYKNMLKPSNSKYLKDTYAMFIEYSFTPAKAITVEQWYIGTELSYYSSFRTDVNTAKKFGYKTYNDNTDVNIKGQFLKTGQKNYFWGMTDVSSKKEAIIDISTGKDYCFYKIQ